MQLHQLEQFCAVARTEHMSQAAEALHISQPSLSLNIIRLEEELGVKLFDRVGRNIKLNKYGHALLFHVEQALDSLETAKQAVLRIDHQGDNRIRLADAILNSTHVIVSAYMEEHPEAEIMHQPAPIPAIIELLRNGSVDLAIAALGSECDFGFDICWLPVRRTRLMMMVPENHPFAARESISLHELDGEPLVGAIQHFDSRDCFDHYCEQAGFAPNYVHTSLKPFLFNQLTRERGYISIISEVFWGNRRANAARNSGSYLDTTGIVGVRIEDPVCTLDYGILTSKKHLLSTAAEDFRTYVQGFLNTRLEEL